MSTVRLAELREVDRAEDSMEFAYRALRTNILTGQLAPGTVLSQVRLARDLGISRTPLREALRRLMSEQLLAGDFNRRVRVSELNLDDFDQIYAMRIALEPIGIAATVPGLSGEAQATLTGHVEQMSVAITDLDLERFRTEHRAFHLGLTASSGERIQRMLADLWDHSERYRLAYLKHYYAARDSASADRLQTSQSEHRMILAAAVAGDAATCSAALVAHLERTVDVVFTETVPPPRPRLVTRTPGAHDAGEPRRKSGT